MKLAKEILYESNDLKQKGYSLPEFDREQMIKHTKDNPVWVQFGAGNIFRAFHANIAQKMLNSGYIDSGSLGWI